MNRKLFIVKCFQTLFSSDDLSSRAGIAMHIKKTSFSIFELPILLIRA